VIGGHGKALPALLGLQSLTRQNAVLEMAPENEYLTIPGPGGYNVNRSPGTVRYKLERAVSGHLILPCDEYDKVSKDVGGVEEPKTTYYGYEPKKAKTCEISTQTETHDEPIYKRNNRKNPRNS